MGSCMSGGRKKKDKNGPGDLALSDNQSPSYDPHALQLNDRIDDSNHTMANVQFTTATTDAENIYAKPNRTPRAISPDHPNKSNSSGPNKKGMQFRFKVALETARSSSKRKKQMNQREEVMSTTGTGHNNNNHLAAIQTIYPMSEDEREDSQSQSATLTTHVDDKGVCTITLVSPVAANLVNSPKAMLDFDENAELVDDLEENDIERSRTLPPQDHLANRNDAKQTPTVDDSSPIGFPPVKNPSYNPKSNTRTNTTQSGLTKSSSYQNTNEREIEDTTTTTTTTTSILSPADINKFPLNRPIVGGSGLTGSPTIAGSTIAGTTTTTTTTTTTVSSTAVVNMVVDKRVVFVSLFQTQLAFNQKLIPIEVLDTCILLIGAPRRHMFPFSKDSQEVKEAQKSFVGRMGLSKDFLMWVAKKERQNLVIYFDSKRETWKYVSLKFESILDPSTGENYMPLILDTKWWKKTHSKTTEVTSKYGVQSEDVIKEIVKPRVAYKSAMELLWHSNPSLICMDKWDKQVWLKETGLMESVIRLKSMSIGNAPMKGGDDLDGMDGTVGVKEVNGHPPLGDDDSSHSFVYGDVDKETFKEPQLKGIGDTIASELAKPVPASVMNRFLGNGMNGVVKDGMVIDENGENEDDGMVSVDY